MSYLYYADRIYQINLAIAGIAIGTVLLPTLSKHIKTKNQKKIDFIQNKSIEFCIFLSLPAMFALLIASKEITSSLFGYGSFSIISVENSAIALFYFAFGLPAFALIKIFSTFLFARHNTKAPFYFSLVSVLTNILISVIFFNKIGFIIIPISTTISFWINTLILFIYICKKDYYQINYNIIFSFLKISCSSILSSYFFYFLIDRFSENLDYYSDYKLFFYLVYNFLTFFMYIFVSVITKAFKFSDIKLKY